MEYGIYKEEDLTKAITHFYSLLFTVSNSNQCYKTNYLLTTFHVL